MPFGRAEDRLPIGRVVLAVLVAAVGRLRLAVDPSEPGFGRDVVFEVNARRVQGVHQGHAVTQSLRYLRRSLDKRLMKLLTSLLRKAIY